MQIPRFNGALLPSCPNRDPYAYLEFVLILKALPTRQRGAIQGRAKRKSRMGEVLPAPIRECVVFNYASAVWD